MQVSLQPGDVIAARCTYNSTGVDHSTHIGTKAGDEMCNLYIMYYTQPGEVDSFLICINEEVGLGVSDGLPRDSDQPPTGGPECLE